MYTMAVVAGMVVHVQQERADLAVVDLVDTIGMGVYQ
jgi:hypothetical protein